MFNVRPDTHVPGFRVRPPEDVPGFRVSSNGQLRDGASSRAAQYSSIVPLDFLSPPEPTRFGFPEADAGSTAAVTPTLVPAPGGDGSGTDKCTLMPRIGQFGMCLYLCPDGTVRRSHDSPGALGCRPWIMRNDGLGL